MMKDMTETPLSSISDILSQKPKRPKPPAYPWQDLALQVIKELNIPPQKRNSVFKVCRDYSKEQILRALNDTKELVERGEKWRYFFKIIDNQN